MSEKRVYFWHLKALGYCNRQMRVWCKEHDVSWRGLCSNGIDAAELLTLDNSAMARNAVEFAKESNWSETPVSSDGAA